VWSAIREPSLDISSRIEIRGLDHHGVEHDAVNATSRKGIRPVTIYIPRVRRACFVDGSYARSVCADQLLARRIHAIGIGVRNAAASGEAERVRAVFFGDAR